MAQCHPGTCNFFMLSLPTAPSGRFPETMTEKGAEPRSAEFFVYPPTVEPSVMSVTFPSRGKDDDIVRFTIKNPGGDRVTYMMKGTKVDKFHVVEGFGFVESKGSTVVELFPCEMLSNAGWSRFDYFKVICAPAPKGENWEAREIWKKGGENYPKQTHVIQIPITTATRDAATGAVRLPSPAAADASSKSEKLDKPAVEADVK